MPKGNQPIPQDPIEALRQQREFLRQILDINPHLIFAKDRAGRFTLVNKALADIYGTTIEQLIGKTDADFNPNPEQVAFFRQMDLQVMDTLKEIEIPEEVISDATGKKHWLQTIKRPIVGADGKANQMLGVATDITQRKNLEDQLRHSQKMEALGKLAGGIAHDFNNMLAVILGNAERLLNRTKQQGLRDEDLATSLEMIVSSSERAALLIRRLLAFSRKQPISPIVLDLNRGVTEMTALLRRLLGENVQLHVRAEAVQDHVRADPGQIEQIMVNLAVNARDAMPHGGTLTVRTLTTMADEALAVLGSATKESRFVKLSVSDTGLGMTQEVAQRIFEPFFTTKPVGQGTGLGLSIVYGIVKQIGGHIVVDSAPGQGTRFDIYLPTVDAELTESGASGDVRTLRGTETILLCEDDEGVLDLTRTILEDHGYTVLAAGRGRKALQIAKKHESPIHLLLTDVVMPDLNGRQLAERIRELKPDTRVLFMTAYSAGIRELSAEHAESPHWIDKPFTTNILLRYVRNVLDG
ncbi:MAG: ATP-binding protein [Planctomycetota bacterium]